MKTKTIGLFVALSMLQTFMLTAQDQQELSKVKEVGIGLKSFNSFSMQFRWGNERRLFRISGNIGGTTSNENSSNNSTSLQDAINGSSSGTVKTTSPVNLDCGLSVSILRIKPVSEKFGMVYGGIAAFTYSDNQSKTVRTTNNTGYITYPYPNSTITETTKNNSQTFRPSLGIAFGAVYQISPSFLLYAEIDPNIYYAYNKKATETTTAISGTYNYTQTINSPGSANTFGLSDLSNSGASLTIVYRISK